MGITDGAKRKQVRFKKSHTYGTEHKQVPRWFSEDTILLLNVMRKALFTGVANKHVYVCVSICGGIQATHQKLPGWYMLKPSHTTNYFIIVDDKSNQWIVKLIGRKVDQHPTKKTNNLKQKSTRIRVSLTNVQRDLVRDYPFLRDIWNLLTKPTEYYNPNVLIRAKKHGKIGKHKKFPGWSVFIPYDVEHMPVFFIDDNTRRKWECDRKYHTRRTTQKWFFDTYGSGYPELEIIVKNLHHKVSGMSEYRSKHKRIYTHSNLPGWNVIVPRDRDDLIIIIDKNSGTHWSLLS